MCVSDVEYARKLEAKIQELREEIDRKDILLDSVTHANSEQVLTYPDLTQWLADNLPGASVHLLDGEVIIHTGLTVEMNGELMALEDIEEEGE